MLPADACDQFLAVSTLTPVYIIVCWKVFYLEIYTVYQKDIQ